LELRYNLHQNASGKCSKISNQKLIHFLFFVLQK